MRKTSSIKITYTTGHSILPYAPDEKNGNFPMIWLSKEPDRIGEIPELYGEPELRKLIRSINAPSLALETFSCSHRTFTNSRCLTKEILFSFIFRDRKLSETLDEYMKLACNIATSIAESVEFEDNALPFEIRFSKNWLKQENLWAHTASIYINIQAPNENAVSKKLAQEISFLTKLLTNT